MRTLKFVIAVLLLIAFVGSPILWSADQDKKQTEQQKKLEKAHRMVRFWRYRFYKLQTPRAYRRMYYWTERCAKLMKKTQVD